MQTGLLRALPSALTPSAAEALFRALVGPGGGATVTIDGFLAQLQPLSDEDAEAERHRLRLDRVRSMAHEASQGATNGLRRLFRRFAAPRSSGGHLCMTGPGFNRMVLHLADVCGLAEPPSDTQVQSILEQHMPEDASGTRRWTEAQFLQVLGSDN